METIQEEYIYDAAISFLWQDELLATQLHDVLATRLKVFLYSKKLDEVSGTDGFDTYTNVFFEQARLNIVLFREQWGQTNFTRVEETAIKNRIFQGKHKGWESLIVVKLDESSLPAWIPKYYTYIDFNTSTIERITGVVEYKIQALGGKFTPEMATDHALRRQRQIQLKRQMQEYLDSSPAVADANTQVDQIIVEIDTRWKELKQMPELKIGAIQTNRHPKYVSIKCNGFTLIFLWEQPTSNWIGDATLSVRVYSEPRFTEHRYHEHAKVIYKFAVDEIMNKGWKNDSSTFIKRGDLVEVWIKELLSFGHDEDRSTDDSRIVSW